jgi:hypothetical protein
VASLRARLSIPWLSGRFGLDERHRAFPIHLFYFEPRTLKRMVARAGFEVTALETYGIGLDELFYQEGTSSCERIPSSSRAERKLSEPIRRTLKRVLFELALGENVLAVCAARAS